MFVFQVSWTAHCLSFSRHWLPLPVHIWTVMPWEILKSCCQLLRALNIWLSLSPSKYWQNPGVCRKSSQHLRQEQNLFLCYYHESNNLMWHSGCLQNQFEARNSKNTNWCWLWSSSSNIKSRQVCWKNDTTQFYCQCGATGNSKTSESDCNPPQPLIQKKRLRHRFTILLRAWYKNVSFKRKQ